MVADRIDLSILGVVAIFLWVYAKGSPTISRVWRGSTSLSTRLRWRHMGLRAYTLSNYSMLSVPVAHAVLCDIVNRDIALWVSELMLAVQQASPTVVPPQAGTVLDPAPMPCPCSYALSNYAPAGRGCSAASVPAQTGPQYRGPPLPPRGRRVQKEVLLEFPPSLPDVRAHR